MRPECYISVDGGSERQTEIKESDGCWGLGFDVDGEESGGDCFSPHFGDNLIFFVLFRRIHFSDCWHKKHTEHQTISSGRREPRWERVTQSFTDTLVSLFITQTSLSTITRLLYCTFLYTACVIHTSCDDHTSYSDEHIRDQRLPEDTLACRLQ